MEVRRERGRREKHVPMDLCRMKPRMEMPKTRKGRKRPRKALYLLCVSTKKRREGRRKGFVEWSEWGVVSGLVRSPSSEKPGKLTQIETKKCPMTYLSHGWACISSTNVMAMMLAWPERGGGVSDGEGGCGAEGEESRRDSNKRRVRRKR